MKKTILVIVMCLFCFSCGVKSDPEYKSQNKYNRIINLV